MFAWQFAKALSISDQRGWARFVSMQDHYNLLYREEEREMLPLCSSEDIAVIPWSPLARGRLTRPWDSETARTETDEFGATLYRDEDEQIVTRTLEVAERLGRSPAQVGLAWLLSNPVVTAPIVGVTKPKHLEDAVAAVDLDLPDDAIAALEEPYRPHPIAGHV
jgi:aryl-alcohol dehydrogenase (NADP+)